MIIALLSLLKEMTLQPGALAVLQQQEHWLSNATLTSAQDAITVTRVSQTRQTDISRLQVRVQDENLRKAMRLPARGHNQPNCVPLGHVSRRSPKILFVSAVIDAASCSLLIFT